MIGRRTWPAMFAAVLLLGACGFSDEVLIPSLTGEDPSGNGSVDIRESAAEGNSQPTISGAPPQLGQTQFEPDGVTPGQPTGTEVGQRVQRLRGDLQRLQGEVDQDNDALQGLRQDTVSDATRYQQLIGGIQARLQIGTTPGNPTLVRQWNDAQSTLDQISDNIGQMNSLANDVADSSSLAAFILESVRATYGLTGAVDEDHRQLAILEDDTNRTVVLIDRLLNELNEDIARQTNYIGRERSNLTVLSLGVKNGEMLGTSLANRAYATAAPPRGQPVPVGTAGNRRPLVVIRFDRPDVPYEEPLFTAVSEALNRRPGAAFDLVSVVPQRGTPAQVALNANNARRHGEQVMQSLIRMGLPGDRVSVSSTTSNEATASEVHLYVR